jgi:hypothetical protein
MVGAEAQPCWQHKQRCWSFQQWLELASGSGSCSEPLCNRSCCFRHAVAGADIPGSLFERGCKGWTLRSLRSLLSETLEAHNVRMPGVNEPYLYIGSWRSLFAWCAHWRLAEPLVRSWHCMASLSRSRGAARCCSRGSFTQTAERWTMCAASLDTARFT